MSINNNFSLLETILFNPNEGFYLLDKHFDRLFNAIQDFKKLNTLLFPKELTKAYIYKLLVNQVANNDDYQRVRLLVNAIDSKVKIESIQLAIPRFSYCSLEEASQSEPCFNVVLDTQPSKTIKMSPFILHKTTQRDMYDLARERTGCDYHATEDKPFDVILWNEHQEITETSIANIAIRFMTTKDTDHPFVWKTPKIECGLLPGVFRSFLLDHEEKLIEDVITIDELIQAAKVIVT
ncbi:aminotransferase [Cokeromyces recurvatus]|uniref:aminotransferase n=1 Tax=Cokeromyces recurvatus TaxID=90255 RepID=UPI0022206F1D|nr:aminotransferase [Cokeromyces recurvatus]KAI7905510.1 aminotransferase [Cokeromyces recurvatus]